MKMMRSTFSLALILYLCVFLTGAPFVLTASAKMTPIDVDEATMMYEIKKGDTLWHLAKNYRNDALLWMEFKKYNIFTNPDLIYPKEMLQVKSGWGFPGDEPPMMEEEETAMMEEMPSEIDVLKMSMDKKLDSLSKMIMELKHKAGESDKHHKMVGDKVSKIKGMLKAHNKAHDKALKGLNGAMMSHAEETKMGLSKVKGKIKDLNKDLNAKAEMLGEHQKKTMKLLDETTESMQSEFAENEKRVNDLQAGVDEIHSKLHQTRGEYRDSTKAERTLGALAVLVGGIAVFTLNSLGESLD